jgi:hypothetical protein
MLHELIHGTIGGHADFDSGRPRVWAKLPVPDQDLLRQLRPAISERVPMALPGRAT